MENKLKRFNEAFHQAELNDCAGCPCREGCKALNNTTIPCETLLFLYVEHSETKNFSRFFK